MTEESESLEGKVEGSEETESGNENSDSNKGESNSENYNESKKGKKKSKKGNNSKGNYNSKKEAKEKEGSDDESKLEKTVQSNKARSFLKEHGYSNEEIESLLENSESKDVKGILDRLPLRLRGLAYIALGFLDLNEPKNVQDGYLSTLKKGDTPYLYVAGALNFPFSTNKLSKYSGLNIIRLDRKSPDDIRDAINEAYRITGNKAVLIGFSLGGNNIAAYQQKYGSDNVGLFVGIDSEKKLNQLQGNSIYVNGAQDLAIVDKILRSSYWDPTTIRTYELPSATHAGFCYGKNAIKNLASIINFEVSKIRAPVKCNPVSDNALIFKINHETKFNYAA